MITFSFASPQAAFTAAMSASTLAQSPSLAAPMSMTMSTSRAPFFTATAVSAALLSVGMAPRGNPTTQQGVTSLPSSSFAARAMRPGFTQTEAKWYSRASAHSFSICAALASGFNRV